MVAVALAGIVLGMGMTGLGKAKNAGSSRGLATAVASEFKHAREKAVATGSPVAVIIPAPVGRSLFWLEGTTEPTVSRVVNFEGDYPRGALTVGTYAGPNFIKNATMPGFKADVWGARMDSWLPNEYKNDFVIMFTPNGSVTTNELPSADGSYRVIVGMGAKVSGGAPGNVSVSASGEAYTVAISLGGAVESDKGFLGGSGGNDTNGAPDPSVAEPPNPDGDWTSKVPIILGNRVTPPAEDVDGQQMHVLDKGEYLTLEVFAQSGDGKPIFADWNDNPTTKSGPQYFGRFSVPNGDPERMEFYPEFDWNENGSIDGNAERDIWRSVWTWTPPPAAEPGDTYSLQVDVKDAKFEKEVSIADIPPVTVAPPGEIVFERQIAGRWHLFTMWADGTRQRKLTEGPHDYTCASSTADGKVIAYQRGNEVWVMNFDGTGQTRIAANGHTPTISPTGSSIAFYNSTTTKVVVKRLEGGTGDEVDFDTNPTNVNGAPGPAGRITYHPNGRIVYFTPPDTTRIAAARLTFPGNGIGGTLITPEAASIPNDPSGSQVGGASADRLGHFVYYHGDQNDPYIGRYPLNGDGSVGDIGGTGGPNIRVSVGQLEACPAPSPDGRMLLFTESGTIYSCLIANVGDFKNAAAGTPIAAGRRPAWIKQRGSF